MGTTFKLCRIAQNGSLQEDDDLPSVQAVFSFWDYPRFTRQLALDARLGEVWEDYEKATGEWSDFICARIPKADLARKRQSSKKQKKGRRTRMKNWGKEKRGKAVEAKPPPEDEQETLDDERVRLLKQRLADTKEAVLAMADSEPLVEFIMVAEDGILDSKACERIGPSLLAVANSWEPTSEG